MTARPDNLDMRGLLPPAEERQRMIGQWLAEDIGRGDITTNFLIPASYPACNVFQVASVLVWKKSCGPAGTAASSAAM